MRIDEVCSLISEELKLNEDTCRSVLNAWNKVAIRTLVNGRAIELGKAGYVYLKAASEGAEDEESATASLVKNIKGHIRFSKETKEAFNKAVLVPSDKMTSGIYQRQKLEEEQNP